MVLQRSTKRSLLEGLHQICLFVQLADGLEEGCQSSSMVQPDVELEVKAPPNMNGKS